MNSFESLEIKLKQILNKLVQINAIRSFKLSIKWGKEDDLSKVDLVTLNNLLGECLDKIIPKPRRAEIRNVIPELVKKKNDFDFLSEISENTDVLTESDSVIYCADCNLEFENDDAYSDHTKSHDTLNRLTKALPTTLASKFGKKTLSSKNISDNRDSIQKVSKSYLCEYCGRQFFQMPAWKSHLLVVHKYENSFKCGKCSLSFPNEAGLKSHVKVHEREDLQFKTCLKTFASAEISASHALTRREGSSETRQSDENEPVEFKCNDCERSFESKRGLKSHIRHEHRELTCSKQGCAWYGLKFTSRKEFLSHVRSECKILPSNKFSCFYSDCGKVFKQSKYLRKHIRLNHLPPRTVFSCHLCPKIFFEKTKLNRHVEGHQEEKFRCGLCSKTFTRGDALKRHNLLVHEKEKRFQCKFCRKTFSLKYNRDCHEENVHVR